MKIKLVKLTQTPDKFILVSDGEIKKGDKMFSHEGVETAEYDGYAYNDDGDGEFCFKVISENPDFSLLSEEDCKEIGWVDVEKLAKENNPQIQQYKNDTGLPKSVYTSSHKNFIDGFKKNQSLNDKMFSLDDVENAIRITIENCWVKKQVNTHHPDELLDEIEVGITKEETIRSLQQTSWDVEVERDDRKQVSSGDKGFLMDNPNLGKPLIKNSKIKVIKIS